MTIGVLHFTCSSISTTCNNVLRNKVQNYEDKATFIVHKANVHLLKEIFLDCSFQ